MKTTEIAARITSRLAGRFLVRTERREHDWVFLFDDGMVLTVACPWRILIDGRTAFGDCDHAQQFGLPKPIDGAQESGDLLGDKIIQSASIRDDSGDLAIYFGTGAKLEILNVSSGYEGWELGGSELRVIAMGGGSIAVWTSDQT